MRKAKPVNTQTRAPRPDPLAKLAADNPDKHFLLVQKDGSNFEGSLDNYLGMLSPTDEDKPMYSVYSEERKLAGNGLVLLVCSKEDYQICLEDMVARHHEMEGVPTNTLGEFDDGEELQVISGLKSR